MLLLNLTRTARAVPKRMKQTGCLWVNSVSYKNELQEKNLLLMFNISSQDCHRIRPIFCVQTGRSLGWHREDRLRRCLIEAPHKAGEGLRLLMPLAIEKRSILIIRSDESEAVGADYFWLMTVPVRRIERPCWHFRFCDLNRKKTDELCQFKA